VKRLLQKLFGTADTPAPAAAKARPAVAARKMLVDRQVYAGREQPIPDWLSTAPAANLAQVCQAHVVCSHPAAVEKHRLYRPGVRQSDGSPTIEYDGICVTCLPMKNFGEKIAREERNARVYRYGDLNHVLEFCCGTPQNCPFFREVVADQARVARKLR
jgi:hypothetical protein